MKRNPLTSEEIFYGLDHLPKPVGHYSRGGTFFEGVRYAERMHSVTEWEDEYQKQKPEPEPEPKQEEPVTLMAIRKWGDDKEFYYKPLLEAVKDLPLGTYELYLAPIKLEVKND